MDTTTLARAARHMAGVIGECHHARRRMTALTMTLDKYLADDGVGCRRPGPVARARDSSKRWHPLSERAQPGVPARGFPVRQPGSAGEGRCG